MERTGVVRSGFGPARDNGRSHFPVAAVSRGHGIQGPDRSLKIHRKIWHFSSEGAGMREWKILSSASEMLENSDAVEVFTVLCECHDPQQALESTWTALRDPTTR